MEQWQGYFKSLLLSDLLVQLTLKSTLNTLGWKDGVTQDHIKVVWTVSHDSFAVVSYSFINKILKTCSFFFLPLRESCNLSRALKATIEHKNASNSTSNVRALPK